MLPLVTNIREAFKNGQDDEQNFIQNLALFLCTFLKEHGVLIEPKVSLNADSSQKFVMLYFYLYDVRCIYIRMYYIVIA